MSFSDGDKRTSNYNQEPQKKTLNRFLNPPKIEETYHRETINVNRNEKNNRFNSNNVNNVSYMRDNKNENPHQNMFNKSVNNEKNNGKNKEISIDSEELFPSLTKNVAQPQIQENKSTLNYKSVTEKLKTDTPINNPNDNKSGWLKLSTEKQKKIDGSFSTKIVKTYNNQDISEYYRKESEMKIKNDNKKAFDEWNRQRIERIKASYDYNYVWDENKRNEMLYGISKEEYINNLDDNSGDEGDDYVDDNNDTHYKGKKKYNDDLY